MPQREAVGQREGEDGSPHRPPGRTPTAVALHERAGGGRGGRSSDGRFRARASARSRALLEASRRPLEGIFRDARHDADVRARPRRRLSGSGPAPRHGNAATSVGPPGAQTRARSPRRQSEAPPPFPPPHPPPCLAPAAGRHFRASPTGSLARRHTRAVGPRHRGTGPFIRLRAPSGRVSVLFPFCRPCEARLRTERVCFQTSRARNDRSLVCARARAAQRAHRGGEVDRAAGSGPSSQESRRGCGDELASFSASSRLHFSRWVGAG